MSRASIRKFLLIYLLLAITLTTTLTAIGNYYLDQKDIQEHLDTLMAISALTYQSLLGNDLPARPIPDIQKTLASIPFDLKKLYKHRKFFKEAPQYYLEKFNFQIWNQKDEILIHSSAEPIYGLNSTDEGFSDKMVNHESWRLFTSINPESGTKTIIAERYDTRNDLGQRIAEDDVYIMFLTFPLSGLLIWLVIGRGLISLERVTKEVANREPSHLESVRLKEIPDEIKPLVNELNKLFYRLKEGFEREKRFAADAAHELRTPLAALKTQVQVALNTHDLNEKNLALQKIITSVNRSTHVVQQLLTLSKLVPEESNIAHLDDINLIQITREILAMLAPAAVEAQVDLGFEHSDTIPSFKGNLTAIGILIRNLVDNAIRYCGENDGRVDVRVYQENQKIILEVEDNGPGIPEELQTRVFERFFRILGNKSTGSGLGLAIANQICELHQARIQLSNPNSGPGLIVRVYFSRVLDQKINSN